MLVNCAKHKNTARQCTKMRHMDTCKAFFSHPPQRKIVVKNGFLSRLVLHSPVAKNPNTVVRQKHAAYTRNKHARQNGR